MRNFVKGLALSSVLAAFCVSGQAMATVIGGAVTGGGNAGAMFMKLVPPPIEVGDNNQNDIHIFAFDEDQNIMINAPLAVDLGTGPVMGDIVASHYIFFDPGPAVRIQGYIDFDADIFGVITSRPNLIASDFLANTGVTYNSPNARGLENGDEVMIVNDGNGNLRRLEIDFFAGNPGDYVRVLTMESPIANQVPEPGTLAIFGLGLLGLGVARRRRTF